MLCVDDDTKLSSAVADRVYFMDQGRVVWEGPMQEVLKSDQAVAKKFLPAVTPQRFYSTRRTTPR